MANITILEALNRSLTATKKYVDDKVAEANASGGYTHPDSHPASMITGLATVATSGDYNDLTNKPITILTAAENEFIILSELAAGAYLITGLVKYMSTDTAPGSFDNSFVEVTKFESLTIVADPSYITVIDSINNSTESSPRINVQADWNAVDTKDPSYINNKPTIPTVTNDLTNALKANYDAAYAHSQVAHAPSNAQKNSDITKAEIEAKLIGDVTTHTHSQYLTEHQDLTGYATEDYVNSRIANLQIVPITQADYDALETKDPNTLYLITTSNAGSIDSNNHITLSSDLPSGRYTLKYEDENGQPLSDFEDITIMEV